ncbi:MAG: 50S ribosomal protein L11 methyltransferase [Desulfarculus sp.]|nr:50S ribosomal protein L11 methyltransferase [Desulfarculus sp.]
MTPVSGNDATQEAWVEVMLLAPAAQADAAADYLVALTGHGVEIDDSQAPPAPVMVKGFLAAGADLAAQQAALRRYAQELGLAAGQEVMVSFQNLADQDWGENWKRHFRPRALTKRLVVAPPWERAELNPGQVEIVIDPGQAFGTGQHESTLLCLRRLEHLVGRGQLPPRLLDVGCGTGILGLAFLLLGGQEAIGIDLDPLAVEASLHNAELNHLAGRLHASLTPLAELPGRFPLVVANLTAKDLEMVAADLVTHLAPAGELIVSGLLVMQIKQVRAALEAHGLRLIEQDSLSGWASLVMG